MSKNYEIPDTTALTKDDVMKDSKIHYKQCMSCGKRISRFAKQTMKCFACVAAEKKRSRMEEPKKVPTLFKKDDKSKQGGVNV